MPGSWFPQSITIEPEYKQPMSATDKGTLEHVALAAGSHYSLKWGQEEHGEVLCQDLKASSVPAGRGHHSVAPIESNPIPIWRTACSKQS